MKIAEARLHEFKLALKRDLQTTHGSLGLDRRTVIVELISDEGVMGFGEASTLPGFVGETLESVQLILEKFLFPVVVGLDVKNISLAHSTMDEAIAGNSSAKAAIDEAFYDLRGKQLGVPAYQLLGGGLREQVSTSFDVGLGDPKEMAKHAQAGTQLGSHMIKIKLGGDPTKDRHAVKSIREAIGPDPGIWLDANEGYRANEALRLIRSLRDFGITWVEQPVPRWDVEGLRYLRDRVGVPIIADESVFNAQDALRLVREQAADLFVLKLMKCGGLYPALGIASIAEAAGIDCVVIQTIETGIGTSAAVHLALALPNAARFHGLNNTQFIANEPAPGLKVLNSVVSPGNEPGLGVIWRGESSGRTG